MQKKLLGLLFAAAAYGIYKYTKMTPEEKEDIKQKGRDFLKDMAGIGNNTANKKMASVSNENNY